MDGMERLMFVAVFISELTYFSFSQNMSCQVDGKSKWLNECKTFFTGNGTYPDSEFSAEHYDENGDNLVSYFLLSYSVPFGNYTICREELYPDCDCSCKCKCRIQQNGHVERDCRNVTDFKNVKQFRTNLPRVIVERPICFQYFIYPSDGIQNLTTCCFSFPVRDEVPDDKITINYNISINRESVKEKNNEALLTSLLGCGVMVLGVLIGIGICVFRQCNFVHKQDESAITFQSPAPNPPLQETSLENRHICLMYVSNTESFDKVVNSLRNILESALNSKVYDLMKDEFKSEICESGALNWITSVTNKSMKVVVILTQEACDLMLPQTGHSHQNPYNEVQKIFFSEHLHQLERSQVMKSKLVYVMFHSPENFSLNIPDLFMPSCIYLLPFKLLEFLQEFDPKFSGDEALQSLTINLVNLISRLQSDHDVQDVEKM